MTPEEFIATVKHVVHDSAFRSIHSTLESPPGRRPAKRLTELSQWYHTLSPADRQRLSEVVQLAVHSGIFGLLSVIDGVRAIGDCPGKGSLELAFTHGAERQILNDPEQEFLHGLYQGLVYPEVFWHRLTCFFHFHRRRLTKRCSELPPSITACAPLRSGTARATRRQSLSLGR